MSRASAALALGLIGIGVCASCGKRGDPLPPFRRIPATVDTLLVRQQGGQLVLSWHAPRTNRDGTTEDVGLVEAILIRRVLDLDTLAEEHRQAELLLRAERALTATLVGTVATSTVEETAAEPPGTETEAETASVSGVPPPTEEASTDEMPTPSETSDPTPVSPATPGASLLRQALEHEQESGLSLSVPLGPTPIALRVPPFELEGTVVATVMSSEPGESLSYTEEVGPSWIGMRVEYAVRYRNRKKREGALSRIVAIEPVPALPSPGAPVAEAEDGFVRVGWGTVETESVPALGYNVLRRSAANPEYGEVPLNPMPVEEPEFQDTTVPFEEESCYVIKTVALVEGAPVPLSLSGAAEEGLIDEPDAPPDLADEPDAPPDPTDEAQARPEPMDVAEAPSETSETAEQEEPGFMIVVPPLVEASSIESDPSSEVCLTPEDLFAPPKPADLVAVASASGVLLSWDEVRASDLRGYRVYRADSPDGPFTLLTSEPVAISTYLDHAAPAGATLYYAVSAVDGSPVENESEKTGPVRANVP